MYLTYIYIRNVNTTGYYYFSESLDFLGLQHNEVRIIYSNIKIPKLNVTKLTKMPQI